MSHRSASARVRWRFTLATGRRCYPLALKLSSVLDPGGRSVILDLASVAALVDSGMAILEAGLAVVEGDPPEPPA